MTVYEELLALADSSPLYCINGQVFTTSSDGASLMSEGAVDTISERKITEILEIDVLGEIDRGGIKVFSEFHRKSLVIPDIGRLTFEKLLQIAGPPVKAHVLRTKRDDVPDMFSIDSVRDAIALIAGYNPIGDHAEIGIGCWQGLNEDGTEAPAVVMVGAGEAAEWNGHKKLEKLLHPRRGGRLIEMGGSTGWYQFEKVDEHLQKCDKAWAEEVIQQSIELFSRWTWRNQELSPFIVTGLILSTFIQTLWDWRPQVAIIGPTKAGKSSLFKALEGIFGQLTILSSNSTAAGLRQGIVKSARVVLCDEFENGEYREQMLEMLRSSGRGTVILRGTSNQRGQEFILQHIVWVAAIEVNLRREPDRNRFIMLELAPPSEAMVGKLELPPEPELRELGQKLLAIAIKASQGAKSLATRLRSKKHEGIDSRIVECYAVPAAIIAEATESDDEVANRLLGRLLEVVDRENKNQTDEKNLLGEILASPVRLPAGKNLSVSQIIFSSSALYEHSDQLESHGVAVVTGFRGPREATYDRNATNGNGKFLFIAHKLVTRFLLNKTEWDGQSLDQILKRIPGAFPSRRRVASSRQYGVQIPMSYLEANHFTEEGEGEEAVAGPGQVGP